MQDRGPELLAVIWVFTSLTIIVVALKAFTRAHVLHALGWDDFFIFFSAVLIIICTSIFTYDVHLGMGKHEADIDPTMLSKAVKINYIGNPFGIMAYSFPNISVAILVNRLLAPDRLRSAALYGLAISQCVIAAVACVLLFAQATPTAYLWNPTIHGKLNYPSRVLTGYSYFVGSYTAMTDVVLAVVPVAAFWKLNLNTKTKLGLCFLMACTLFAAICAAVKTSKLHELADLNDFTYGTVDLIIWAIVEANVIIIAACMPSMRPFFHHAFKQEQVSEGRGIIAGFRNLTRSIASSRRHGSDHSLAGQRTPRLSASRHSKDFASDITKRSDSTSSYPLAPMPTSEPQLPAEPERAIWRTTDFSTQSLHTDDGGRMV
ncbi:hypothetical protein ANO11243_028650 [Dothideomycetidae sp. 11243]|nr:hypothetical protein ANO11243_028650 [fungal sp. No.11243]